MNGWKMSFPLGEGLFSGVFVANSFRGSNLEECFPFRGFLPFFHGIMFHGFMEGMVPCAKQLL